MLNKYAALIFDVVDSRKLDNRFEAQEKLKTCTRFLNHIYSSMIVKEVICGSGDEFQGLFNTLSAAYQYARSIQFFMQPIYLRCGIGYGTLKYDNDTWLSKDWISTEIDGDAYYFARDAINAIDDKESNYVIFINSMNKLDKPINTFLKTCANLKNNQSKMCKLLELILDFVYPLDDEIRVYNKLDYEYFALVVDKKLEEIENSRRGIHLSLGPTNHVPISSSDIRELFSKRKKTDTGYNEFYTNEFFPRGIVVQLASMFNLSRQNINNHIRLGNIKIDRNLDGTIYNMLKMIEEEQL